jgi:hypothetical protein
LEGTKLETRTGYLLSDFSQNPQVLAPLLFDRVHAGTEIMTIRKLMKIAFISFNFFGTGLIVEKNTTCERNVE